MISRLTSILGGVSLILGTACGTGTPIAPPTLGSPDNASGVPGDPITWPGTDLSSVTSVVQNGVSWTITAQSATSITATVPEASAFVGPVTFTNPAGSADAPDDFTLYNFNFRFDIAAVAHPESLPPGLAQTMSPAPNRIVALSDTTAAEVSTLHTYDYRGGLKGLWGAWPTSYNEASKHMGSGSLFLPAETNTVNEGAVTGPDGVAGSAARVNRDTGTFGLIYRVGNQYTHATRISVGQVWLKEDVSSAPTGPGAISGGNQFNYRSMGIPTGPTYAPGSVQFLGRTPGAWRRMVGGDPSHVNGFGTLFILGAAQQPLTESYYLGGTANLIAGTGSFDCAFPAANLMYGDIPPAFGADANSFTQIGALETHVDSADTLSTILTPGGVIGLVLDWMDSPAKTATGFTAGTDQLTIFSMETPEGDWYFRLSLQGWDAKIAGVTTGLTAAASLGIPMGDQPMRGVLINDPNTGFTTGRVYTNGARNHNHDKHISIVGDNAVPTSFHLGSAVAGGDEAPRLFVQARRLTDDYALDQEEFVFIGDSTLGLSNEPPTAEHIYTSQEAIDRPGMVVYALGGDTVSGQTTKWGAGPSVGNDAVTAAILRIGRNDIAAGTSAATTISGIASLISSMRSSNANMAIIGMTLVPCDATLTVGQRAQYALVQEAITGGGDTPLDFDYVIDTRAQLDQNSDGTIDVVFSADQLHPNMLARHTVDGPAIRAALVALDLL